MDLVTGAASVTSGKLTLNIVSNDKQTTSQTYTIAYEGFAGNQPNLLETYTFL